MGTNGMKFGPKNRIRLTATERNLILGTLLGDGGLQLPPQNRPQSASLKILHCAADDRLVYWKYRFLRRMVRTPPKLVPNPGYKADSKAVRFNTLFYPELLNYQRIVYPNGKKTITQAWLRLIDSPLALVTWFLDDGTLIRGVSARIATHGFTKTSVQRLRRWLKSRWHLSTALVNPKKKYWALNLRKPARDRLMRWVRRFAPNVLPRKVVLKREELFCPMCGSRFTAERSTLTPGRRVILCKAHRCRKKWHRMIQRITDRRSLYMT
jgi:hypothetical protein